MALVAKGLFKILSKIQNINRYSRNIASLVRNIKQQGGEK